MQLIVIYNFINLFISSFICSEIESLITKNKYKAVIMILFKIILIIGEISKSNTFIVVNEKFQK